MKALLAIGQASTFTQTDEQYAAYLRRLINRGLPADEQLSPRRVNNLLRSIVADGYAQNGAPRYRLTPAAQQLILNEVARNKPSQDDLEGTSSSDTEYNSSELTGPHIITPAPLPRSHTKAGRGWLDAEKHEANKTVVTGFGPRSLEVLAELELAGGTFKANGTPIHVLINKRIDTDVGSESFLKVIGTLEAKKLIEMSEDNREMILTPAGIGTIALFKTYPEYFRREYSRKIGPTTLKITEFIMEETCSHILENGSTHLPDHGEWLFPKGSTNVVNAYLATSMDMSEDVLNRRLYEIRGVKGFVEVERDNNAINSPIVNVRLTRKGMEYVLASQKKLQQQEQILNDEAVQEALETMDACLHLAEKLGEDKLYDSLKKRYDERHLFEFTHAEFAEESAALGHIYEQLRRDYIFEFSSPLGQINSVSAG